MVQFQGRNKRCGLLQAWDLTNEGLWFVAARATVDEDGLEARNTLMRTFRLFVLVLTCSLVLSLGVIVAFVPTTHTSEGPMIRSTEQDRIRLDHGLVTLSETIPLPQPTPAEIAFRIWVQRLPSHLPFLEIRATSADRTFSPVYAQLPPADGQFYLIQLPWWSIPSQAQAVSLALKGHGVLVLIAADDQVPNERLVVNTTARETQDLAFQIATRAGGIEHYVPVLKMVEHKPGVLGWPKLFLVLAALYVALIGGLVGVVTKK